LKAARDAEAKAQATARKEAELDSWIDAHPDFAADEGMQAEVAELIQETQAKGRWMHLDDAYLVVATRRQAAEQTRLQAEARARVPKPRWQGGVRRPRQAPRAPV
jgi:hypothetical protein